MDRSNLHKELMDIPIRAGSLIAESPLGESVVLGRRGSAASPRSVVEGVRAGDRGHFLGAATLSAATSSDRLNEQPRSNPPPAVDPLSLLVWLVVIKAADRPSGTLISLRPWLWQKDEVTIGRETADITFADQALSKSHLSIHLEDSGQGFTVRDLGSTNGSLLALDLSAPLTQLISGQPLRDGNVLRIGDILLAFRCYRRTPGL